MSTEYPGSTHSTRQGTLRCVCVFVCLLGLGRGRGGAAARLRQVPADRPGTEGVPHAVPREYSEYPFAAARLRQVPADRPGIPREYPAQYPVSTPVKAVSAAGMGLQRGGTPTGTHRGVLAVGAVLCIGKPLICAESFFRRRSASLQRRRRSPVSTPSIPCEYSEYPCVRRSASWQRRRRSPVSAHTSTHAASVLARVPPSVGAGLKVVTSFPNLSKKYFSAFEPNGPKTKIRKRCNAATHADRT
jgi:hypothetical protein